MAGNQITPQKRNFLNIASIALGVLSVWPYLIVWAANILQPERLPAPLGVVLGVVLLFIAPCNGVPLGLAGIVTGIFGLAKLASSDKKTIIIALAIVGILLSIAGCISNIWFFSTMEPWSSVPQ